MIRRLLVFVAVLLGAVTVAAGPANAANVVCLYNHSPVAVGLCAGV